MRRREFLGSGLLLAGARLLAREAVAAESLYVLGPNDPSRLRMDFNANKGKVRLVFMLSPT